LQRAITDFGADISFRRIPDKLKEHYGITVPESSAQKITERHAEIILTKEKIHTGLTEQKGAGTIIHV